MKSKKKKNRKFRGGKRDEKTDFRGTNNKIRLHSRVVEER